MLNLVNLDEDISAYYDEEMKTSKLLKYEARIALSDCVRNYTYEKCFDYYKISTSIKRTLWHLKERANLEYKFFILNRKEERKNKKGTAKAKRLKKS